MPQYLYRCARCDKQIRRILTPEQAKGDVFCKCGEKLIRTPKGPSSNAVETLDNGLMNRKIERFSNAEELHKERAKEHTRRYSPKKIV